MRSDKTARNYMAAIQLAASLAWLKASFLIYLLGSGHLCLLVCLDVSG
jgi:hypothetical protein